MTASDNIALFVGGPWDGRRRVVYDRLPYVHVPIPQPMSAAAYQYGAGNDPRPAERREARYRRVELPHVYVALYVLDSIPWERIIDELVTGYRLPKERDRA